jgi:hypothetical protein
MGSRPPLRLFASEAAAQTLTALPPLRLAALSTPPPPPPPPLLLLQHTGKTPHKRSHCGKGFNEKTNCTRAHETNWLPLVGVTADRRGLGV